jgi:hypothetical protein
MGGGGSGTGQWGGGSAGERKGEGGKKDPFSQLGRVDLMGRAVFFLFLFWLML